MAWTRDSLSIQIIGAKMVPILFELYSLWTENNFTHLKAELMQLISRYRFTGIALRQMIDTLCNHVDFSYCSSLNAILLSPYHL